MNRRPIFLFLVITFFSFIGLSAKELLTQSDVPEVMDQLFDYHIDKKEMEKSILERSLKVYIQNFDQGKTYLLQSEVYPFLFPSSELLNVMLKDYQAKKSDTFFVLNGVIQKSILRARDWRRGWEKNPRQLIQEARGFKPKQVKDKNYASSMQELKERQHERLLLFISYQMKEIDPKTYEGKEAKLVALCEKQLSLMENEFLGINDRGLALSTEEMEHQVVLRALKALAGSLDAHTAYYSPDEAYAMKVQLEKGMCGIGVVLREGVDGVMIHDILKGGPADKCGKLKVGDTIVEVDGESVKGISFHRVLEIMRGKEGTKTVLGIMRPAHPEPQIVHVELQRSKIVLEDKRVDVQAEPFGDGIIGKITLHSFYEGDGGISSEKDIKAAIDSLRSQGTLYGLVLDMRENSGGFLSQSVKVSGLFITNGIVVISKYSDGTMKYYRTVEGKRYFDGPLVVLISRGSASATEIVAQALKDYGVAIVVGDEKTYGKGTIQHQTVTNSKKTSFFKVTVGKYYTVSGKSTQIDGVKADIVVPTEYNFEEVGEEYLDFPLASDSVAPAYDDSLADIDVLSQKWFYKYYKPYLQQKDTKWDEMVPKLRTNSQKRVSQNKNYQNFLKAVKKEVKSIDEVRFGVNDLQMEESVNILKDMIILSKEEALSAD